MKRFIILCTLILVSGSLMAQGNLGQAGLNFLQIPVEPRGAALGGAITAVSVGGAALYWNPAGIASTENVDFMFSHMNWFLDTKLMFGGVVKNLGKLGAVGISFTSFYMDDMEITTVYDSDGTGEYYSSGDLAVGFSYARAMTDRFTFGLTAKYVHEYIWNETASQVAFDVGSLYQTDFLNLRIGMAVRNFGGKLKFSGDGIDARIQEELDRNQDNNPRVERLTPDFRLPQVFQMGIAFDPFPMDNGHLTVLADVDSPSDQKQRASFGVEYGFYGLAYLRAGYRLNHDAGDFSFGGGISVNTAGMNARVDYAFSTRGVFGNVHQFALGFSI